MNLSLPSVGRRVRKRLSVVGKVLAIVITALLLSGCATHRVDWGSRVGQYTYDQAVVDLGPPDKQAKLESGITVAEWLTRRGGTYAHAPFGGYGYYPYWYGPRFYPMYLDTFSTPNYFLRLIFGPDGTLTGYKKLAK